MLSPSGSMISRFTDFLRAWGLEGSSPSESRCWRKSCRNGPVVCLGWLQACSTIGNISAALVGLTLASLEETDRLYSDWKPWRFEFLVGALPVLMIVVVARRLKEPERWREMREPTARSKAGIDARFAENTDLASQRFVRPGFGHIRRGRPLGHWLFRVRSDTQSAGCPIPAQGYEGKPLEGMLTRWTSIYGIMLNAGAFLGIYTFSRFTHRFGRRPAFAFTFVMAMVTTVLTFWGLGEIGGITGHFLDAPIMGFFQLALFGGYAIYLPKLFPTRLRSTGTSFCYNVSRYLAAFGPFHAWHVGGPGLRPTWKCFEPPLRRHDHGSHLLAWPGRVAFWPETKGKPLPE